MDPDKRYAIFPDFFGVDQVNWLALSCELCAAANAQDFKQIFKCQPSVLVNIIEFIIKMRIESFQMNMLVEYYTNMNNTVYANAVKNIINNYQSPAIQAFHSLIEFYKKHGLDELLTGDLEVLDNWGITFRNNQKVLVIIDAGFNDKVKEQFYNDETDS